MICCSLWPLAQHVAHLVAQVDREVGVGVGNGLVLAHQAAQLGGDAQHLRFQLGVGRGQRRVGGVHGRGQAQRQQGKQEFRH